MVAWDDAVKGRIEIANSELDDLVIARQAPVGEVGVPTYNFCVVVDDIDMQISHVIRGDGHVMNTPRQINIFRALGVEPAGVRPHAHRCSATTAKSSPSATAPRASTNTRQRLSARGDHQRPRAPRLVTRQRRNLYAAATG